MEHQLSSTPRAAALLWSLVPALALALPCVIDHARAQADEQLTSSFAIDDDDPVSSVPTNAEAMKQPLQMGYLIMLLTERADAATKRGDHAAAAKFWAAIAKAVPDRSLAYTRMCKSYEAAGDMVNALSTCREALAKPGVTVVDNLDYVRLQLAKAGSLSASEIADVESVAQHLEHELGSPKGSIQAAHIRCQLGSRLSDRERLQVCVRTLQELAPNDAQTVVYTWSLAMEQRDFPAASRAIERGVALKLSAPTMERMRAELVARREQAQASHRFLGAVTPVQGLMAALLIATVALSALALRRRRASQT